MRIDIFWFIELAACALIAMVVAVAVIFTISDNHINGYYLRISDWGGVYEYTVYADRDWHPSTPAFATKDKNEAVHFLNQFNKCRVEL